MKVIYNGAPDSRAFKDILGTKIPEMLESNPDVIYLDADLMSCIGTAKYAKAHPDRAINVGIAESNMAGIAAGLAAAGFKPICHSFGPFASRRCFDQVFMSCGYAHNDITMIGTDPGVTAGYNGGTHMPFEDMAIMRAIPNMVCFEPTDGAMLARAIPQIIDYPGAVYIRLFRKKPEHIFDDVPDFKLGKAITVKVGKDVTLVASGIMVEKALKAAEILKEEGIDAGVLNIHTWKPIDEEAIVNAVKKTGALVTCENHTLQGGLGSAVSEVVVSKCPAPVGMIGVNNTFGEVGKKEYLAEKFHLTVEDIVNKAKETIALKK